jgi:hypothetical protein
MTVSGSGERSLGSMRYVLPPATFALLHVLHGAVLYLTLRSGGRFSVPFMNIWKTPPLAYDWLYLFSAWDTDYYLSIARSWYPQNLSPSWAFFPLYPALIRLGSTILVVDVSVTAFAISVTASMVSIVVFQRVGEHYMHYRDALVATFLYFLLPPVFTFSFALYTEPLFLALTLAAWYLHIKSRDCKAAAIAALASLTRAYGILIILPIAVDNLRKSEFRKLRYLLIPISSLAGWLFYGFVATGVWLAPPAAQSYWQSPNALSLQHNLLALLEGNLNVWSALAPYAPIAAVGVVSLAFTLFLTSRVVRMDRSLGLYLCTSLGAIAYFAFLAANLSLPRYLAFLFPIGLALKLKSLVPLFVALILLWILDYFAWLAFLTTTFFH